MKKISRKLQSLVCRVQKIQEEIDDLKSDMLDEMEDISVKPLDSASEKKYDKLNEDTDYLEDVYYMLDDVLSELENYID